ncbi:MAG: hypothetical protein E5V48_02675 [Mesorhizobium sp.]|nr:MAG: hypothetical protein E5V48_02675 [Mesorhizobium sp.]
MDRNFSKSLALVLKSEGLWSDNPADPGGATMKGVTLANFRRYVQPNATKDDLRHITDAQIATVYRRFYWDAVAGAELPDGVDYATMDFGVNSGPSRAIKYLQAVVGVPQDGRIGPATIDAAKAKPAGVVIDALCDARLAFLKRLPTWGTFGKGWQSRVESVRKAAITMTAQPAIPAPPAPASAPVAPAAPPAAPKREPQPLPAPGSKGIFAGFVAALALIVMAAAGAWHDVVNAFWSVF